MTRVEAVELVAYGLKCDGPNCDKLFHTRNSSSRALGYYIPVIEKVREIHPKTKALGLDTRRDLYFCSRKCMLKALDRNGIFWEGDRTNERIDP